jgi:hypothetical protein
MTVTVNAGATVGRRTEILRFNFRKSAELWQRSGIRLGQKEFGPEFAEQ